MTDQEIVRGLLAKDEKITHEFFFVRCRPLMYSVINHFFPYAVNYDELINELYLSIMSNDGKGLRTYDGRSSIYQWFKVVSFNYFSKKKNRGCMIADISKEHKDDVIINDPRFIDPGSSVEAKAEISSMLPLMQNERRRLVLEKVLLEGMDYEELSLLIGIKKSNLYNIKKLALLDLAKIYNLQNGKSNTHR